MRKASLLALTLGMCIVGGCGKAAEIKPMEVNEVASDTGAELFGEPADAGYYKVSIGETSFTYPTDKVVVTEAVDFDTLTMDGDDIYIFNSGDDIEGVPVASIRVFQDDESTVPDGVDMKGNWWFVDNGLMEFMYNYSADGELLSSSSDTYVFTMSNRLGTEYEFRLNCSENGSFTEDIYNSILEAMYNLAGEQFEVIEYNGIVEEYNK